MMAAPAPLRIPVAAPAGAGAPLPIAAPVAAWGAALAALRRQCPHAAGMGDAELARFLGASRASRGGECRVDVAAEMLRRRAEWREANFPLGAHPDSVQVETIHAVLAERRFEVLPRRNCHGQQVLYVSLRDFSHGHHQVVEHLVALLYLLERAREEAARDGAREDLVCVLNCDGVTRAPTALLQRATPLLGAYYPGLLSKVVLYPVGPVRERLIKQMLPFVDVGGVMERAEVVYAGTPEALAAGAGCGAVGGRALRLADFPASLCTVRAPRPAPPPHLLRVGPPREAAPAAAPRGEGRLKYQAEHGDGFTVHTPWYPEGVTQHDVTLEEEMVEFARFMLFTPAERQRILGLRTSLQGLVARVWPGATVKTVGALALDCITSGRQAQFAVEDCESLDAVPAFLALLRQSGFHYQLSPAAAAAAVAGDVSVTVSTQDVHCSISFHAGEAPSRQVVPLLRRLLREYPAARPVYVILYHILEHNRCLGSETGGITAKALLLMVLHVCARIAAEPAPKRRTLNPEQVLQRCLRYYGKEFDFDAHAIDARQAAPVPRRRAGGGGQIFVVDPADAVGNCAAGCTRVPQIKIQLQYCEAALARSSTRRRGRRGRTPLSAVISYDPLWARRAELNARLGLLRGAAADEAAAPRSPTASSAGRGTPTEDAELARAAPGAAGGWAAAAPGLRCHSQDSVGRDSLALSRPPSPPTPAGSGAESRCATPGAYAHSPYGAGSPRGAAAPRMVAAALSPSPSTASVGPSRGGSSPSSDLAAPSDDGYATPPRPRSPPRPLARRPGLARRSHTPPPPASAAPAAPAPGFGTVFASGEGLCDWVVDTDP